MKFVTNQKLKYKLQDSDPCRKNHLPFMVKQAFCMAIPIPLAAVCIPGGIISF